jgi:queuine tRNA-ribosyltransferase
MCAITFEILHRDGTTSARVGRVTTPHGAFDTPAFMPVGTKASVKGLSPRQVRSTGSQIILNNAYHLMLRPGADLIRRRGGVHAFMRWDGPILTDSGGYQAFSMSDINRIDEDGVSFRSIVDGALVQLTPEKSMQVQNDLGADIIMAFDDCPPCEAPDRETASAGQAGPDHRRRLQQANERTIRWLERCARAHARPDEQALFGIVQGGTDESLRRQSLEQVCSIDLPGFAIGGVAVGEGPAEIRRVVEFTAPRLPEKRPRYLMGVGYERDIVMAVRAGMDMFDCVLPTRNGRNGSAFTREGRLQVRNARFAEDDRPIDPACPCEVCAGGFSRAYLRHLFLAEEMLGPILLSLHNISHFQRLMLDIREAIRQNAWSHLSPSWPVLREEPVEAKPPI